MKVPTYDNFQTQIAQQPNVQVQAPGGPTPGAIAADQAGNFGRALTSTGDAVGKIALDMQDQANQVLSMSGTNALRQFGTDLAEGTPGNPGAGFLARKGAAALAPNADGVAPTDEFAQKLRDKISDISGSLSNDQQRRMFMRSANDYAVQFNGKLQQHMLNEHTNYQINTYDGAVKIAADQAERNWKDSDGINKGLPGPDGELVPGYLQQVKSAAIESFRVRGITGTAMDAALAPIVSAVHAKVVTAALQNDNPAYALGYLAEHKGDMTGDDILKLQGHVNQAVWLNQSQGAVQVATTKTVSQLAPANFDRMTQITLGSESNGQRYAADGKTLLTSPKGAKGEMQVLDSTMMNPGFGLPPLPANATPDQRAQRGRDYLQALLQKYGEPAKAWAAYNAGPGTLDAALKGAVGDGAPDSWLAKLPKETQAYVATNMKTLNSGAVPRTTELDFVNTALAQLPAGAPPQVVKMTREQAVTQFGIINKSIDEKGNNALAAGQNWLANNPGSHVEQLPTNILDDLKRYAPGRVDDLYKFNKAIERGDTITNNSRYNDIVTHPEQYAQLKDPSWNQLQTELSPADFRSLSKERAKYLNGGVDNSAEGLNRPAVNRYLNQGLNGLRIPTTLEGLHGEAAENVKERLGGIRKYVDQSIFAAQKASGQKFTDEQVKNHINNLFATDVTFKNVTWYGGSGADTSQKLMSMQLNDLPSGAAEGITRALIASGNKAPTNNDILNRYRTMHAK